MKEKIDQNLYAFVVESNHIENIYDKKRHEDHYAALKEFLRLKSVTVESLEKFVKTIQPDAYLRTSPIHRVWIGGHEAPSALVSLQALKILVEQVNNNDVDAQLIHHWYENLHPFIDGNGRSGRALWLWQMRRYESYDLRYKFLRMFYYQTLTKQRGVL